MTRLLIGIASTRPGRVGLPVGEWCAEFARSDDRFDVEIHVTQLRRLVPRGD